MSFFNQDAVVELLSILKIQRQPLSHQSVDGRCYDTISIRLSGSGCLSSAGKEYKLTPDHILYSPQNIEYTQSTNGETIIAIHFINYNHTRVPTVETVKLANSEQVQDLASRRYSIWEEKRDGFKQECTSLLYHLLYLVRRQIHEETISAKTTNERIAVALDYIHQHYREDMLNVSELAKMSAVSETYFRRLFKSIYSVSPCRYIILLRLEYAGELLLSGLYTVAEVSEKSGFCDVKYFERLFKQYYHITPGKYNREPVYIV